MDLKELKKQRIAEQVGLEPDKFGKIIAFIDFGNVNRWFDEDTLDMDSNPLEPGHRIEIKLEGLQEFLALIAQDARFYYGFNPDNKGSLGFIKAAAYLFGDHRVFSKPIQQVRHYITPEDKVDAERIKRDKDGEYVLLPKCNFDVEIAVDAMRLIKNYNTICLLSGDSDFAAMLRYLKQKGKKVILIKGGRITGSLAKHIDLKIEASAIKTHIAKVKQRPGS